MTRRAGIALIGAGVATAIPYTRGMTSTVANRLTNVETAADSDALLGIEGIGQPPRDQIIVTNNADSEMEVTISTDSFEIDGGSGGSRTVTLPPGTSQPIDFSPATSNTDQVDFSATLSQEGTTVGSVDLQRSISVPTVPDTIYRIRNVNSGLYLTANDPSGGWFPSPGDVYQDTWDGAETQQWNLQNGDEATLLEHVSSGALLTVGGSSWGNDFEEIVTEEASEGGGTDDQRWELLENENGSYRIRSVATGDVVDVEGESADQEANVIAYPWKGEENVAPNQMWTFEPL